MKIAILGAGNIGGTLGRKLATLGHEVIFGVRDPHSAKAQKAQGTSARIGSLREAADFAAVLVIALPLNAVREVLASLGDLSDKIIIDTTNAFGGLPAGYTSGAQAIADWSGSRRVVKAFNATSWESLENPIFAGVRVETFVCADDAEAKAIGLQLAREVGFEAIDAGGLENAALTENFAKLWGTLAIRLGHGRDFAFKMVRR